MITSPVIFLSAVSKELKTARQSAANCLTSLGFTPDWQDVFPTSSGHLLSLLRRKVDAARSVIQIVGRCYGAEPETPTPEFGRVSFTQYEALYALSRGKPVHYLFTAPGFPADPHDPEPDELFDLQSAYIARIEAGGGIRHYAASASEMDNRILRLRDDLTKLRRRAMQWAAGFAAGILAVGSGVSWLILRDKEHGKAVTELGTDVRKVLERDAILLQVLRDYPAALRDAATGGSSQSESSVLAAAYISLEAKYKLPQGSLSKDLPLFATQLLLRQDTSAIDRANALLVQKKFAEAEAAALAAKDEALRTVPDVVSRAIQAFETAAAAASGQHQYARALSHYEAAAALTDQTRDAHEWSRIQQAMALVLDRHGDYSRAASILTALIPVQERVLGPEHPYTLGSRNNLGNVLNLQGKPVEAEKEHRAVLAVRERILGPEDHHTLASRHNLANALYLQRKFAESEAEHRAVLAIQERVFGPEHPDALQSRGSLVPALTGQGKREEAENEYQAVPGIMERVVGAEHPDTLRSHWILGVIYAGRKKHREAEEIFRRIIPSFERILGPGHPETLEVRNNLATALGGQGRNAEEETEHRAVLGIREHVLGPEHPATLATRYNLALCLKDQKKFEEAKKCAETTLTGLEKALGSEHPHTMEARQLVEWLKSK